jgi:hypothetical protein
LAAGHLVGRQAESGQSKYNPGWACSVGFKMIGLLKDMKNFLAFCRYQKRNQREKSANKKLAVKTKRAPLQSMQGQMFSLV